MRLILRLFCVGLAFTFIVGCAATARFAQTGQVYPPWDGPVKVLSASPEGVKYVEIGIVSSFGGTVHEWIDLITAMQKEAAKRGANAIIVGWSKESSQTMVSYTPAFGLFAISAPRKDLMAMAIRILE